MVRRSSYQSQGGFEVYWVSVFPKFSIRFLICSISLAIYSSWFSRNSFSDDGAIVGDSVISEFVHHHRWSHGNRAHFVGSVPMNPRPPYP